MLWPRIPYTTISALTRIFSSTNVRTYTHKSEQSVSDTIQQNFATCTEEPQAEINGRCWKQLDTQRVNSHWASTSKPKQLKILMLSNRLFAQQLLGCHLHLKALSHHPRERNAYYVICWKHLRIHVHWTTLRRGKNPRALNPNIRHDQEHR